MEIVTGHHVDRATHDRRCREPLPTNVEGTIQVGPSSEWDQRYKRPAPHVAVQKSQGRPMLPDEMMQRPFRENGDANG